MTEIMSSSNLLKLVAGIAVAGSMTVASPEAALANCGHEWAKPGTYTISGNFRGKQETAGAELTRDCRIELKIPGVFTGGPVARDGRCVRFTFKIDKEKQLFKGRWCDATAVVDWKGKRVEANIRRVGFR
jgi:hypothetical protein